MPLSTRNPWLLVQVLHLDNAGDAAVVGGPIVDGDVVGVALADWENKMRMNWQGNMLLVPTCHGNELSDYDSHGQRRPGRLHRHPSFHLELECFEKGIRRGAVSCPRPSWGGRADR